MPLGTWATKSSSAHNTAISRTLRIRSSERLVLRQRSSNCHDDRMPAHEEGRQNASYRGHMLTMVNPFEGVTVRICQPIEVVMPRCACSLQVVGSPVLPLLLP